MKQIILISGKASNGKTTFAEFVKQRLEVYGERVCIMRYAQYLKFILSTYYRWDGKDKSPYWRGLLQELGTERIRLKMNRPLFHAQRICEDIEIVQNDFDYVLLDDTRFKNEIDFPKAYFPDKVSTLRIVRNNFVSPLTPEQQLHPSEIDLDNVAMDEQIVMETGVNIIKACAFEYADRLVEKYE